MRKDLASQFVTLLSKGQKRVMEVLQARIQASVQRPEVLQNMSDQTNRVMRDVADELRQFLDDLRDLGQQREGRAGLSFVVSRPKTSG